MNENIIETNNYKRYTYQCKCGCNQHCGHSCLDCDHCTECECEICQKENG